MRVAIIVHGGAGTVEPSRADACRAGVERAANTGWEILSRGGTSLDAVEAAVRVLEADPEFNAGYGAVLNRLGTVEVDAGIMDGQLRAGAVASVPWMRHPITLARRLLEAEEHLLLVGGGALLYAREHGLAADPPEAMISPRARARHSEESARLVAVAKPTGDTVGACAVDARGRMAAATSTGGTAYKRPGRVGDSPLVGAGVYADDRLGAASATGHGESIMRVVLCKAVLDRIERDGSASAAAKWGIAELADRTQGRGGIIVVGRDGTVAHAASTPQMPWASVVDGALASGVES